MGRPKELNHPTRTSVMLDKPTLDVLRKIDPNISRAVRILANWHVYAADRDARAREAQAR